MSDPSGAPADNPEQESATQPGGFETMGLAAELVQAVVNRGYQEPTPIQAKIIPKLIEGRDVLAMSETGSGKTAAFALPLLHQIAGDPAEESPKRKRGPSQPQVVVLAPTRELALQVAESFDNYARGVKHYRGATLVGGQDYPGQLKQLRAMPQVVVATPGRLMDHLKQNNLDLSQVRSLVLDEADEMLNQGFLEDVQFIIGHTPDERQTALFSATMPEPIRKLAEAEMRNPEKVRIRRKTLTAESVRQRAIIVPPRLKLETLRRVLESEDTDGVIVFTKTKDATMAVADKMMAAGFRAIALNGDMPQNVRTRAIEKLKEHKIDVLVATDVAARGLDVHRVSHVVNFDLPHDVEAYIHRIGRTGRAGRPGEAILLLTPAQRRKLGVIERTTKQTIEIQNVPSADQINTMRVERFRGRLLETLENEDLAFFESMIAPWVEEKDLDPLKVAAALAHQLGRGRSFLAKELDLKSSKSSDRASREDRSEKRRDRKRDSRGPEEGMKRYRIAIGHRDHVKPGQIVGAIAGEGGIGGGEIGSVEIFHSFSLVDLPEAIGEEVSDRLQQTKIRGRLLKMRPDRGPSNFRSGKPGSSKRGGPGKSGAGKKFGAKKKWGGKKFKDGARGKRSKPPKS